MESYLRGMDSLIRKMELYLRLTNSGSRIPEIDFSDPIRQSDKWNAAQEHTNKWSYTIFADTLGMMKGVCHYD